MRAQAVLVILCLGGVATAETTRAPELVPEKPGEKEFLGCNKYPESKRFRWGVRGEVGVSELVASLGEISCQTIIVGPSVQRAGKVTLEVPDLLTAPEVYRLFYSSLESLGLTVEHSGGKTLKIVDGGRAKEVATPLGAHDATPSGDQFVTRLVRLAHARPQDLSEVLTRMKSKDGDVSVYAAGNALIVTDRGTNVRRMEELVEVLDVKRPPSGDALFVIAAHQQAPVELAATLEKVLVASRRSANEAAPDPKGAPAATGPIAEGVTALIPVDGARMMVMVGSPAGFQRVLALAARIDPQLSDEVGGQAHVVYLANTNAEEMATTLQSIGLASKTGSTGSAPAAARPGAPPAAIPLQGEVRIGADKVSNAIVVFANGADFQMVRDLIGKLDLPRRQVYVEATILDITVEKGSKLGLSFHGGHDLGSSADGFAASGQNGVNSIALDATSIAAAATGGGLLAGVLGKSINIAGFSLPSFGVILQALENSKDVSVISRPHLLTMDNVKASLSVGQSIPYAAQSLGAAVAGASILTSYQRVDVALRLDLTPHLNDSDSVRLELDGEISDVPDGATSGPGGPTTNKRTIKTSVVVRDGETIVLGGLQKDSESESIEKIPLLGDIPVLGRLFQTRSKQRIKQDLLIVLTPYVIRGPEDLKRINERKQAERQEFIERFSAFQDDSVYEANVDYHRKRGLLQEINLTAQLAETEAVALRKAERSLRKPVQEGAIEEPQQ